MRCKKCGAYNPENNDLKECLSCGADLSSSGTDQRKLFENNLRQENKQSELPASKYKSIGGWLILYVVMSFGGGFENMLFPLSFIGQFFNLSPEVQRFNVLNLIDGCFLCVLGVIQIYTTALVCSLKPYAIKDVKRFLLSFFVYIFFSVAIFIIFYSFRWAVYNPQSDAFLINRIGSGIVAIAWFYYFSNSKRVQLTFPQESIASQAHNNIPKTPGWLYGNMDSIEDAKWGIKIAIGAAIFLIVVNLGAFIVMAITTKTGAGYSIVAVCLALGAVYLGRALFFTFLMLGLKKKSRFCAVAGFLFLLKDLIDIIIKAPPKDRGIFLGVTLFFMLIFLNSIRGTFAYHKALPSQIIAKNVAIKSFFGILCSSAFFALGYLILWALVQVGVDVKFLEARFGTVMITVPIIFGFGAIFAGWLPFTKDKPICLWK